MNKGSYSQINQIYTYYQISWMQWGFIRLSFPIFFKYCIFVLFFFSRSCKSECIEFVYIDMGCVQSKKSVVLPGKAGSAVTVPSMLAVGSYAVINLLKFQPRTSSSLIFVNVKTWSPFYLNLLWNAVLPITLIYKRNFLWFVAHCSHSNNWGK